MSSSASMRTTGRDRTDTAGRCADERVIITAFVLINLAWIIAWSINEDRWIERMEYVITMDEKDHEDLKRMCMSKRDDV